MTRFALAVIAVALLAPPDAFAGKYRGVVGWFSAKRGYGFIKTEVPVKLSNGYECPNVFVHLEHVKSEADKPLQAGWEVTFDAVRVPRQTGCSARSVERETD